ncbi:MAG: hypothetical protein HYV07_30160 [Deltaproteobacteria bacterium]|nr:hypothetical protein [Deltaproteobacteria bacterium]
MRSIFGRTVTTWAVPFVGALALAACGDDEVPPDGGTPDSGVHPDGTVNDIGVADSGAEDGGVEPATVEEYCDRAMANCTGDNQLYADRAACLAAADQFPVGSAGDQSGDSLNCRTYHAGVASQNPGLHCPHASASGGGLCGDYCEVYCGLTEQNCSGNELLYPDHASCLAACAVFPKDGIPDATQGNSVQCRIYHAGALAAAEPAVHCAHASASGGGVCGSYCDTYCDQALAHCTDANEIYPGADAAAKRANCLASCEALPTDGDPFATEGNSVQCRTYHASFPAVANAALHCPHAAVGGGGVCGERCDAYCDQVMANCEGLYSGTNAAETRANCEASCAAFPSDPAKLLEGNSVECRTYHASFPAAANGALHCPHAGAGGGGVCGTACESYCDQAMANCTGLYPDRAICLLACDTFPTVGTATTSGNSVECRTYHASWPATISATSHCPHASINGGGVCGDYCEVYCGFAEQNCGGTGALYPNHASCMGACAAFPTTGTSTATQGNSVQCRSYHASFPAIANQALHCPHASSNGGGVCGAPCEAYCDQAMANCSAFGPTDSKTLYADRDTCLAFCAVMREGDPAAVSGNSVQCRTYHASFPAIANADLHCDHASIGGGGVCGSACEVYCDFEGETCGFGITGNNQFVNRSACEATCALYPQSGDSTATTGNNVECRTYHASAPADANPVLHCPHSGTSGGGVCQ